MSLLELFEYTLKFNLAAPTTAMWIYMILIAVFVVFGFGFIWGKMWNKEWKLGAHLGALSLVLVCALGAAYAVFNLIGNSRMESWFQEQRLSLARSIADSSRFSRSVLLSTWDQIVSKGGQDGLPPPIEGGDEIRLNSPEDAYALALTAAEETRAALRNKLPFSLGVPISTRNPTDIATETVDTVRFDSSRYPTIVTSTNEWSSTAATVQANHALDTAYASLKPGTDSLKTASLILLLSSLLIPALAIPMSALADIKINPTPKR
jgi:hypothetical protein